MRFLETYSPSNVWFDMMVIAGKYVMVEKVI